MLKTIDDAPAEPRARAQYFRSLAERFRKLADTADEAFRRDSYRGFADGYEDLAAEVEAGLGGGLAAEVEADDVGRAPSTRSA